jgi:hypothetical protein
MDVVATDQYLMYARIQAKHIKTLVETLKELLIDTNIHAGWHAYHGTWTTPESS